MNGQNKNNVRLISTLPVEKKVEIKEKTIKAVFGYVNQHRQIVECLDGK